MKRLYLPVDLSGERASATGAAHHHLSTVLRVRVGDTVELFDGKGKARLGRIVALDDQAVDFELGEWREIPPSPPITLAQAVPKGDKFEQVVQRATELGIARISPLLLERCVVRLDAAKGADRARRWRRIAEEAARQCGRADVPVVDEPMRLGEFLEAARSRGEALALLYEEEREARWGDWLSEQDGPIAFIVGPEGGIAPKEVEQALAAGATSLSLGPRILRTETVALAALSVALHLRGELG